MSGVRIGPALPCLARRTPAATRRIRGVRRLAAELGAVALAWLPGAAAAAGVPAPAVATAEDFLGSLGVAVHWDYRDGVYGTAADALVADIVHAGFRHVRGFDPRLSPMLARQGVTTTRPGRRSAIRRGSWRSCARRTRVPG